MIDLHVHSCLSDGTDSIEALVDAAVAAGLDAIALTDHDTMIGVEEAQATGAARGLTVLRGTEISTHWEWADGRKDVHLLAYGADPGNADLAEMLSATRMSRRTRVPQMLARLAALGLPVTWADVEAAAGTAASLGRPHIADAMIARGYAADRSEVFARYLDEGGPAYVRRETPATADAIARVRTAGGVTVIAHPWGRGTAAVLTPDVLGVLADAGLDGVEAHHLDHSAAQESALVALATTLRLLVTGGSDYHGTGKSDNPLGARLTPRTTFDQIRNLIEQRGGCP